MKPWYRSKTIIFNLVMFVVTGLTLPEVVKVIPPDWLPFEVALTAIGNMWLRMNTSAAIGSGPKPDGGA